MGHFFRILMITGGAVGGALVGFYFQAKALEKQKVGCPSYWVPVFLFTVRFEPWES
jgi:hypothetical protein